MSVVTKKCDCCGHEMVIRGSVGTGTRSSKNMKMNVNRQSILNVLLQADKPLNVRDVQARLMYSGIKRFSRRGAGWNYHTVQADLSNLLAMKKVIMIKPHAKSVYDEEEGFTTNKVPHYIANKEDLTTWTINK